MEPIPETLEAISELEPYEGGDGSLVEVLKRAAELARRVAPGLVGVSVASRSRGVTFTLVATDDETAVLDGVQYLTSGPCVEVVDDGQGVMTNSADLFNEDRWQAFARASAVAGVRSTLTFPVMEGEEVTGTVNLYGSTDDTFDDRHEELAAVFRAWAPGAVRNADLSFSTRTLAEQAPEQLREQTVIDFATGLLSMTLDVTMAEARAHLEESARRAGVPLVRLAETVKSLHDDFR